ncbi:hypothetical protein [Saccharothrix luteola]|uniref:hypothetical protein n=1 Tax=Saccharothrix luteola TaxID=2893018 RepID=UPI001E5FD639|nr:hypothetical protein [Saccharothrix luteola]MCC8251562.1 hypothetical protein [Saccharothrix luteola]
MRPSIVITGSGSLDRPYEPKLKNGEMIPAASEAIGRELAKAGFDLAVFSSSQNYIERDVVKGYLGALDAQHPGEIIVHTPHNREVDFGVPPHLKHVLKVRKNPASEWDISYYRALLKADSLLLIGGGRATRIAGVLAMAQRIPIVAVACFGASALTVWKTFNETKNDVTQDDLDLMGADWGDDSAERLVKSLQDQLARREEHLRQQEQREKSARRLRTLHGVVALLSLGLAVLSIALGSQTANFSLALTCVLAGPLLASVGGAIAHDMTATTSDFVLAVVRGAVTGAAAVLLYVAAQRITATTPLDIEALHKLSWFVVAMGLLAGITVDLVWAKMRNADVLSDQPLKVT